MTKPRTLVWATSLVVLQTAVELAYVAGRRELTWGLRIGLMAILSLQLLFARGALRMSAGSVLGLLAFEMMAVVAAIGGDGSLAVRGGLAAVAVTVMVLLMVSITSFPSADLPKIT